MKPVQLFFLLGFAASYLIGNVFKLNLFSPEINLTFLDIFVGLMIFFCVLFRRPEVLTHIRAYRKVIKAFLPFLLVALSGLILATFSFPVASVLISGLYLIRLIAYSSLIILLPSLFSAHLRDRLTLLLSASLIFSSLFQYVVFPDVRHLEILEWDPHYFRVVSSLLDPGFTSVLLLFVFFWLWLTQNHQKWQFWLALAATYLLFSLTYSRSGYLAFLSGWGYISATTKSPRKFFSACLLLLFTVILLPRSPGGEGVKLERTSSIEARIQNWKNSLRIFTDHPILGVGFNTYRYAQKEYGYLDAGNWRSSHAAAGADSSVLFILATGGLLGLAAYLNWIRAIVSTTAKNSLFRTYLAILAVHSIFLNSAFYPYILFWTINSLKAPKEI